MKISLFADFLDIVNELGIQEALDRISKCGYTGVEFPLSPNAVHTKELIASYRCALEEKGIVVPCVSCYASIIKSDPEIIPDKNSIEAMKRSADFAYAIGSKYLHHTIYPCMDKSTALSYNDIICAALDGCTEIAEYAKSIGVTVLYEPQGLVFNGEVGFVDFYHRLKSRTDNVAVCFDVGNSFWVGEDPLPILEKIKNDVVHVHLKDYASLPSKDTAEPREVTLGSGAIDMKEIIKTLNSIGYDGFFSVEDATDTPIEEKYRRAKEILSSQ